MSRNRFTLILGVILFLIPFMGFPSRWKDFFFIVVGGLLVASSLSYSIRMRKRGDAESSEPSHV